MKIFYQMINDVGGAEQSLEYFLIENKIEYDDPLPETLHFINELNIAMTFPLPRPSLIKTFLAEVRRVYLRVKEMSYCQAQLQLQLHLS